MRAIDSLRIQIHLGLTQLIKELPKNWVIGGR